eukprot:TRINITY_DN53649_c0_g1_i1.p1 TRINITY_DN53649_c0_g1~~TRINITY_DN53649_c0_g1_i1.p1  ORF type:complete len:309 (+),score=24.91 TRINITY_DN53649_c0_g1_i1:78-929(+)
MADRTALLWQAFVLTFRYGARGLGWCLVVVFVTLLGFVTYEYFFEFLPLLQPIVGSAAVCLLSVAACAIFCLIAVNYATLVCTSPGVTPLGDPAEKPSRRWCGSCHGSRPERAYHCPICNRCVLRMDHHCPWINGCVGALNQRYFLNFLFWLATGCTFVFITGLPLCMDERTGRVRHLGTGGMVMIVEFLAACAGVCVYGFALWNWFLCLSNQTTNEFFANRGWMKRSKYDRGIAKNLELVFGTRSFCRALLPSWRPLPLEGEGVDELEGTELTEKAAAVMEV